MKKFYITYGSNHHDRKGFSLGNFYTEILAETEYEARDIIHAARGDKWAFCYREQEKSSSIDRWRLQRISISAVTLY